MVAKSTWTEGAKRRGGWKNVIKRIRVPIHSKMRSIGSIVFIVKAFRVILSVGRLFGIGRNDI